MSSSLSESETLKVVYGISLLVAGLIGVVPPLWTAHRASQKRGRGAPAASGDGFNPLMTSAGTLCTVSSADAGFCADALAGSQPAMHGLAASTVSCSPTELSSETTGVGNVAIAMDAENGSAARGDHCDISPTDATADEVCRSSDELQQSTSRHSTGHNPGGCDSAASGTSKAVGMDWFAFLECIAGGVIVSVALVHVLADSVDSWEQASPQMPVNGYPFVFMLAGLSCLFILIADQLLEAAGGGHHHHHQHYQHDVMGMAVASDPVSGTPSAGIRKMRESLLLMFAVLCLHALLEGFALGATTSNTQASVIFIAIVVHKAFEGFALGARGHAAVLLSPSLAPLSWTLSVLFCLVCPIGVAAAAAVVQSLDSSSALVAVAVLLGLAAGSFLYVGLVEVIPSAMSRGNKAVNCLGLSVGFSVMSAVAIWT